MRPRSDAAILKLWGRQSRGRTRSSLTPAGLLSRRGNFEIRLFWQRSNYFLVLNTAIGTGFFAIKSDEFALLLGGLGLISSWLWLLVNLGSKFWQSRWEQQLEDEEEKLGTPFELFSAPRDTLEKIVEKSLDPSYSRWRIDRRAWYRGSSRSRRSA